MQMLLKEPQLRPSAVQVAEAFECMVLLEMGRDSKPNLPAPPAPKRKRRAWPVAAAGALAALCILGVWLYSRFIRSDTLGQAQPGAIDFIREFGTPGWDVVSGLAVAGGTVYVSGDTYGALEGAATGQPDAFLRQYSSHGDVRWTRQFSNGPGSQTHAQDVVATMSGVYVGGSGKEAYLRRYNSFGAEIWKHPLGENVFPADLAGDAGLVYIAGQACCYDAWVAKFDASGKEL